jgi:hypothetical protein
MRGFVLLLAGSLGSCAPRRPLDTHPALLIDTSFTSAQMAQVMGAVQAWEAASPAVRFTVSYATHDAVGAHAVTYPDDDTIYLQRYGAGLACDLSPTFGGQSDGCSLVVNWAGITGWNAGNYSSLTCLNTDMLDPDTAQPLIVQAVTAHELGHSLGLWHIDQGVPDHPVSIMTTHHVDEPADALPTALDVANVLAVHGLAAEDAGEGD